METDDDAPLCVDDIEKMLDRLAKIESSGRLFRTTDEQRDLFYDTLAQATKLRDELRDELE